MEAVDNQIVIVDPREFGEDSIELVAADISAENERSYDAEKKDIREVSKWRTIAWIIDSPIITVICVDEVVLTHKLT